MMQNAPLTWPIATKLGPDKHIQELWVMLISLPWRRKNPQKYDLSRFLSGFFIQCLMKSTKVQTLSTLQLLCIVTAFNFVQKTVTTPKVTEMFPPANRIQLPPLPGTSEHINLQQQLGVTALPAGVQVNMSQWWQFAAQANSGSAEEWLPASEFGTWALGGVSYGMLDLV